MENIGKNLPYKTPDGYFDELPMRVQKRLIEEHQKPVFTVSWSWKRTLITGMAASLVGALVWFTYPQKQYSLGEETLSQVKDETIVAYLKDNQVNPAEFQTATSPDSVVINQLEITDEDIIKHIDPEEII